MPLSRQKAPYKIDRRQDAPIGKAHGFAKTGFLFFFFGVFALPQKLLNATMDQALAITEQFCDDEYRSVSEKVKQRGGLFGQQLENIQTYCEYAKVPFENFT